MREIDRDNIARILFRESRFACLVQDVVRRGDQVGNCSAPGVTNGSEGANVRHELLQVNFVVATPEPGFDKSPPRAAALSVQQAEALNYAYKTSLPYHFLVPQHRAEKLCLR